MEIKVYIKKKNKEKQMTKVQLNLFVVHDVVTKLFMHLIHFKNEIYI